MRTSNSSFMIGLLHYLSSSLAGGARMTNISKSPRSTADEPIVPKLSHHFAVDFVIRSPNVALMRTMIAMVE